MKNCIKYTECLGGTAMFEEEMEVVNEEEIVEHLEKPDKFFFEGLMAFGRYMNLPEDYWEKEGIGWK